MQRVARSALVMHAAEEMYALVGDIESYPAFLPWCESAAVLARDEREQLARVDIAYRGVRRSFTTRNRLTPFARIEMELVEGPFSELSGAWNFSALREDACRASLDLRFEVSGVMRRALTPVFEHIAGTLVDSFVRRADSLRAPSAGGMIRVEVVYALPERQVCEELTLDAPATIADAIRASSLPAQFPEVNWAETPAGVFGMRRAHDWKLSDGDRVEIYRPLQLSPGEARRRRALHSAGAAAN
ncbi:MAG: RnfH family protein [Gammaproteobacteria bacterium]|nr:RnfH family protein [Gammaproteobacteria bacterium]